MENLIACCGLNCGVCEARTATISNDNELRIKTAEKWSVQYNTQITPNMINCNGCRQPGAKIGHWDLCEIRKCVVSKNFQTCAECDRLGDCEIAKNLHQYVPEALENLKNLN